MPNAKNSTRLAATARSVLKRTAPLLREGAAATELSGYFEAASRTARRVLDDDLTSSEARQQIAEFRLLSQGMIAMGTLISHEVELEPGSTFPGLDRALCMAKCLKAYNTCMGRDDGGGEDEPEEDGGIDQPDDPDDDGGLEGLGCYMAYASCLAGCTPPSV
ncbi:MAG: hypothetical protein IPL41_07555 [Micropruina sp.]|nr:hypothetical protein [Micropruina sp.]